MSNNYGFGGSTALAERSLSSEICQLFTHGISYWACMYTFLDFEADFLGKFSTGRISLGEGSFWRGDELFIENFTFRAFLGFIYKIHELFFYDKKLNSLSIVVRSAKAKFFAENIKYHFLYRWWRAFYLFFYDGMVFITYYFLYQYFYTVLISTDLLEL